MTTTAPAPEENPMTTTAPAPTAALVNPPWVLADDAPARLPCSPPSTSSSSWTSPTPETRPMAL